MTIMKKKIDFVRVNNDTYGNPRYVCHFLNFLSDKEQCDIESIEEKYMLAKLRAKELGGRVYRGCDYGGGFVFKTYNTRIIEQKINALLSA